MEVRFFTPDEAKARLPRIKPHLAALRGAFHDYRFAKDQVDELVRDYGEDPADVPGHPAQAEAKRWRDALEAAEARVRDALREVNALGADVKDPLLGLIDFYARRDDGSVVLLCYRDDEEDLRWWHPPEAGFAGRRPLDEF